MDGLTAIRTLRAEETEKGIPRNLCIALTGNARDAQKQMAMEAGFDDVVSRLSLADDMGEKRELISIDGAGLNRSSSHIDWTHCYNYWRQRCQRPQEYQHRIRTKVVSQHRLPLEQRRRKGRQANKHKGTVYRLYSIHRQV